MITRQVVQCRSVAEVVAAIKHARQSGARLVPRGGGHCFTDRLSGADVVLDMTDLRSISVAGDVATVEAGAVLGEVYPALDGAGRALPAGCGPTVGITGLTLGGGIGLIGRAHGLTCDRLIGAQVVLADGTVADCDSAREPDLFWALRGAGGGHFAVVTKLHFETVPAAPITRISAQWSPPDPELLAAAWQAWAPEIPDNLTVNLTIGVRAGLVGASLLAVEPTRELVRELSDLAGYEIPFDLRGGMSLPELKGSFNEPVQQHHTRSEFFARSLSDRVLTELLDHQPGGRLSFTAMGGAYNRVGPDATAFAHRDERFLLQHVGTPGWVDTSWAIAHEDGSGRVYPNFPDPTLTDGPSAYHGENLDRLRAVKQLYDPDRFFDFPQAL
ncbi:FAD-binding oxidoreductase [Nonomuraea sp. NPDC048882]|uniref:FAD-binding oxidoreductase n=1 Tax=unclassified Nonomuraea TaxID=2593643 RepID=UPI0033F5029C